MELPTSPCSWSPRAQTSSGSPTLPLGRRIRRHCRTLIDTLQRAGAHNARVFGSVARAEDTDNSDNSDNSDILVDLDDTVGLVTRARLTRELAELLGTQVDVVPASTLKLGVRDRVLAEAIAL